MQKLNFSYDDLINQAEGSHNTVRTSIFSKVWEDDMNVVKMGIYKKAA